MSPRLSDRRIREHKAMLRDRWTYDIGSWINVVEELHEEREALLAALNTLPAAPVGDLEQACVFLRGKLSRTFVWDVSTVPLDACIIATARALGWPGPTPRPDLGEVVGRIRDAWEYSDAGAIDGGLIDELEYAVAALSAPAPVRLPVIAVCRECGWCSRSERACLHERLGAPEAVTGDEAPPDWCPLRKETR